MGAKAMTEYITKEQAIDEVWDAFTMRDDPDLGRVIEENIERLPAADVAPVVYAKWKFVAGPDEDHNLQFMCDNCGAGDVHAADVTVPYCWKCGARMDGGKNND